MATANMNECVRDEAQRFLAERRASAAPALLPTVDEDADTLGGFRPHHLRSDSAPGAGLALFALLGCLAAAVALFWWVRR